ncbi:tetratricopeptide repeat protein [Amycolatopsis sp. cmx-4-68]|uniref:tetratricopeptide repeat protein n=1 Tax=Amycolatopsis sp. cmx-4-68 TaxID=2790938 RepID=UPI00397DD1FF
MRTAFAARRKSRAPVVQVVTGMGGVGKTSLARAYAQQHLDDYGVVWWVRAEDSTAVDGEYRGLLELVHSTAEAKLVRNAVQMATAWLSECRQPWLLVLDNVPDPAALRGLVPARGNGHVLVTSQANHWPNPHVVHHVTPLDAEAAVELLTTMSRDADTSAAAELAEELDGLPLALAQAASFTAANGIDLATYLRFYRERSADLHADGQPDDYPHTLATTWLLAIGKLSPAARQILDTIAYFAPDSIPIPVLQPLAADEFTLTKAVGELLSHSLVTRGAEGSITIHRLIQAVTRHRLGESSDHAVRACGLVNTALPKRPLTVQTMEEWNRLNSHALTVVGHIPQDPSTFDLRYNLALLHGDMGNVRTAVTQLKALVDDLSPILGLEDEHVLRARHGVAFWVDAYDTRQAQALLTDLLEVQTRILGAEHPDTLITRHDVATSHFDLGEIDLAHEMFEELLPVRVRVIGSRHLYTLHTRSCLADCLARLGRFDEAIKLYEELLADAADTLGARHLDTIDLREDYADIIGYAGDPAAARDLYAETVDQHIAQRGPYHKATLLAQLGLALWTTEAGNPQRAMHLLLRLLIRLRLSLGKSNPLVKKFEDGLNSIRGGQPHGAGGKQAQRRNR